MNQHISILIIDDDITTRNLLENTLSSHGYNIFSAADGYQGLDIAKHEDIDIILLDWMMPRMDGMQVLTELKHDVKTMFIPVFMLTVKDDSRDIDLAISKGAVDYIIKPFNLNDIPLVVEKYLKKNRITACSHRQGFFGKMFHHSS